MTNTIHVITEGATERQVCRILYQKDILSQKAKPRNERWRSLFKDLESEGYEQVIAKLRGEEGYLESLRRVSDGRQLALLVFDQEDLAAPRDRATKLAEKLRWNEPFWDKFDFQPVEGVENLFEHPSSTLHLVLHVSNASIAGIDRRDFDGYLLQLLQGEYKEEIAREFVSAKKTSDLLRKAEEEISRLMENNGYPWRHAKSWLYAYITVFQFRGSHVWFAGKIVECTPKEELRKVFAPLIQAWERLADSSWKESDR